MVNIIWFRLIWQQSEVKIYAWNWPHSKNPNWRVTNLLSLFIINTLSWIIRTYRIWRILTDVYYKFYKLHKKIRIVYLACTICTDRIWRILTDVCYKFIINTLVRIIPTYRIWRRVRRSPAHHSRTTPWPARPPCSRPRARCSPTRPPPLRSHRC